MTTLTPRQRATASGETFYTGKDCPYKHGGLRYTSSKHCVECHRLDDAKRATTRKRNRGCKRSPQPQTTYNVLNLFVPPAE